MLKYLKVSNYLSFKEEVVFDLESNGRVSEHNLGGFYYKNKTRNQNRITKLALIYGANASGKSNLLKVIEFLILFMFNSYFQREEDNFLQKFTPFAMNHKGESKFEICFFIENKEVVYNLIIQNQQVKFESLYNDKNLRFERTETQFNSSIKEEQIPVDRLNSYSSYIGKATADNFTYYKKLKENIKTAFVNRDFGVGDATFPRLNATVYYYRNPDFKERVVKILQRFDIGLEGVEIKEVFNPEKKEEVGLQIYGNHIDNKLSWQLNFEQESAGTRKLFDILLPIIRVLDSGLTLCIDEIGNCLHPKITTEILKMFLDPEINTKNAQLITTIHEPDMMDTDGVVKQQVYFTERLSNGSTGLFRLSDFSDTRNTASYSKKYMLGKYGALPFIR